MNKNLLLSILFFVTTMFVSQAQGVVAIDEGFGSSTSMPSEWTTGGTIASGHNWRVGSNVNDAYDGNYIYFANFSGNKTAILMTPVLNLSVDMSLSFMIYDPSSNGVSVYISTDGGSTYPTLLGSYTNNNVWEEHLIDLSFYTGQSNVKIVFVANTSSGKNDKYYTYLDNIKVWETPRCATPIDLAVSSLTQTQASVVWDVSTLGNATSDYRITMRDEQGNNILSNQSFTDTYNLKSYSVSNLQANKDYIVKI